jgi:hypothetical protein
MGVIPFFAIGSLLICVAWVIKIIHTIRKKVSTSRTHHSEAKLRQVLQIFRDQLLFMPQI